MDLITVIEEILNEKLHFLCSSSFQVSSLSFAKLILTHTIRFGSLFDFELANAYLNSNRSFSFWTSSYFIVAHIFSLKLVQLQLITQVWITSHQLHCQLCPYASWKFRLHTYTLFPHLQINTYKKRILTVVWWYFSLGDLKNISS